MDCIQAQALISEALDGHPVDAAALEAAKTHCRDCPQCGQYVRALSAIRRAVPPPPPSDLPDRIMATVRAEAAAASQAVDAGATADGAGISAASEVDTGSDADSGAPGEAMPGYIPEPLSTPRVSVGGRLDRRQLIAWGGAAAVLLVVVSITAALGIMRLATGSSNRTASTSDAAVPAPAPEAAMQLGAESAPADAAGAVSSVSANMYTLYEGAVYVLDPNAAVPESEQLKPGGQTQLTFDSNLPPTSRQVQRGPDSAYIYVANDSHELQPFRIVQRRYLETDYFMQSAELGGYGAWPTLPASIPKPIPENNLDGSPTFEFDGQDASGTLVYHRLGTDRRAGIAIPPGTTTSDPAAGNPNWTWWVRATP